MVRLRLVFCGVFSNPFPILRQRGCTTAVNQHFESPIVWDIFSSSSLLLQYILFLILRLVLQSVLLVLGFSLSLLKSFALLIQIHILMFLGLFLHSLLLPYFLGVRLFTHANRFCNIYGLLVSLALFESFHFSQAAVPSKYIGIAMCG